jgi:hypothetical protein
LIVNNRLLWMVAVLAGGLAVWLPVRREPAPEPAGTAGGVEPSASASSGPSAPDPEAARARDVSDVLKEGAAADGASPQKRGGRTEQDVSAPHGEGRKVAEKRKDLIRAGDREAADQSAEAENARRAAAAGLRSFPVGAGGTVGSAAPVKSIEPNSDTERAREILKEGLAGGASPQAVIERLKREVSASHGEWRKIAEKTMDMIRAGDREGARRYVEAENARLTAAGMQPFPVPDALVREAPEP